MKQSILLAVALLTLSACQITPPPPTGSPRASDATNFEECVAAGNPVMESYPRQCRDGDRNFIEEIEPIPSDEKPCTREYRPVCGEVQVQCIKAPCPPLKTTYPNKCVAENAKAENIEEGACEDEGPDLKGSCESAEGTWLPDSNECEYISKEKCDELGGEFKECESACRNDPNAEICTLQCVIVCQF